MRKKLLALVLVLTLCAALTPVLAVTPPEPSGAPVCDHYDLVTFRNTSLGGRLTATDPEGEPVTFRLTTEPMKGTVSIEQDGAFVYTPDTDKKGKDYFGFKATDASGNTSDEETVIITIKKAKNAPAYADMVGRAEAYAAARLTEAGVFTGPVVTGKALFQPDVPVTREAFLAMCLAAAGKEVLQDVRATGFADDSAIPAWSRGFVSTGVLMGSVEGYATGNAVVFQPGQSITRAEAAVMLDRLFFPEGEVEAAALEASDAVPAWAAQSVARLTQASVYPKGADPDAPLTRAEAAVMLVNAMDG